jgi:hypothetical protein
MIGEMTFEYLVIGAGMAGVAVISQLARLKRKKEQGEGDANMRNDSGNMGRIAWIDEYWRGGYLEGVPRVPSNTTVELFLRYAREVGLNAANSPAVEELERLPQQSGCSLRLTHAMLLEGIRWLRPQVASLTGRVERIVTLGPHSWQVHLQSACLTSNNVVICTGSHARSFRAANWPLERALNGDFSNYPQRVAVLGNSHSGMLIVRNLIDRSVPLVHLFYKSSGKIVFARRKFADRADVFVHDNTGLKGEVATWCMQHLLELESPQASIIGQTQFQSLLYSEDLDWHSYDLVIAAIGFDRNPLPKIEGIEDDLKGCNSVGLLHPWGLYGFGIAFPEAVYDDVAMQTERAVGLWKCMRFVRQIFSPPENGA